MVMLAGADYSLDLKITNIVGAAVNLTGYTYYAQFRAAPAPGGVVFATYSTPLVDAVTGKTRVSLSKRQTTKLSGRTGIWDLLQTDFSGKAKFILSGKVTVKSTATSVP